MAVPVSTGEEGGQGKLRRISQHVPDNMTFGGHPQPSLDVPYQVSIKDKMCYCAITMIKVQPACCSRALVRFDKNGFCIIK